MRVRRNGTAARPSLALLAAVAILLVPTSPAGATSVPRFGQAVSERPWLNASQTVDQRVEQLLDRMTLDEKARLLYGVQWPDDVYSAGFVPGNSRLGIPALVLTDGPAGVRDRNNAAVRRSATALPAPIALAAGFDPALAKEYGGVLGQEARAKGADVVYAPGVNLVRVAQGGRNFEYLGEDPHLASALVVEEVRGMQQWGVAAQVKHYVGNEQETLRASSSSDIDERTLREIYLPAFQAATTRGGALSVMCAFNQVNGVHACANKRLLQEILKQEWGFRGFVGSDYGATKASSAVTGLDQSFTPPNWGKYYEELPTLVRQGTVRASTVTEHARRVLRVMFAIGMFDSTRPNPTVDRYENGAFARSVAENGMVLLKNEGALLPLDPAQLHSIAIVGTYAARAQPGGGGSSRVRPYYSVSPVTGVRTRLGAGVSVLTADGSDLTTAADLARTADAAVVVVNDIEGEGRDRTSLALPGNQNALIDAVLQANPRTVVVLLTGSPVEMPWLGQAPAVLQAWYPGEEGGNALAAVLFGDVNPSGKLPISFPTSLAQSPVSGPPQYPAVDGHYVYSEGLRVGYRWYDATGVEPLFPFGFGLSYTSFDFANLGVTTNGSAASPTVAVSADVTNTGSRRGAEVAQVYLGLPAGLGEPPRRLAAFAKVVLDPGQTQRVTVSLGPVDLRIWDTAAARWTVPTGSYGVYVGNSSRNLPLQGSLTLS